MTSTTTDVIDGVSGSTAIKAPVRVATTANITLSGTQTIDGVAVVADDRVLVKNQTTATENGIYKVSASAWSRAADFDGNRDVRKGTLVTVHSGTVNENTIWRCTTADPIVIDTSSITFEDALINDSDVIVFTQAGSGAVDRTVQEKLREVISVKDFGAVGDGVTDDTAAIQAALTYANTLGGGRVFLPAGRYRKSDSAGNVLIMYSNTTLEGEGEKSVIFFDDTDSVARSSNDLIDVDNTSNIAFKNFRVEGTVLTYPNQTNQKQCIGGGPVDGLRVEGVSIYGVRYMALPFNHVTNGVFHNNKLENISRDGIRCVHSRNITISNNVIKNVSDDCIALHSDDTSSTVAPSGFVVSNNTIEQSQGVKILGAKDANVSNNVFRRMLRSPIFIETPGTGAEGNTPIFNIRVCDNIFSDTFGSFGTTKVIQIESYTRDNAALSTQPGVNAAPFDYNYLNNIDSGTVVRIGMYNITVTGNIISRTLPAVTNWSDWGYGSKFDKEDVGFVTDPAITDSSFAVSGINIIAPANGVLIANNQISGCGIGLSGILFQVNGTGNLQDFSDSLVVNNIVHDCPGIGFACAVTGSGVGGKQVLVFNNIFDIDPFFRHTGHNSDNSWDSANETFGLSAGSNIGLIAGGNTFKNCSRTGIGSAYNEYTPNYVYADIAGPGDNASNLGVRLLPEACSNVLIDIDGDPTSATFGHVLSIPVSRSTAIPTTGTYVVGHFVKKDRPVVAGTAGDRYIISGWLRLTTGSNHVLNTDWAEARTLTGEVDTTGRINTQTSHTGDTNETILGTITIPAAVMGANGSAVIDAYFSFTGTNTKTARIRFGGIGGTIYASFAPTTELTLHTQVTVYNRNNASSQASAGSTVPFGLSSEGLVTSAVNTGSSVAVVFTGQLTNTGETIAIEAATVRVIYGA